jgi:hypothetical protein
MTSARPSYSRRGLAALAAPIMTIGLISPSAAEPTFTPLLGSWAGGGTYKLQDGTSERLKCDAYYTGSGSQLGIAVRCSSPNNKIELRSKISASGTSLSGNWEERTYNAGGDAKGTLSDSKLVLSIVGGVTGSLTITYDEKKQNVAIATEGTPLKSVIISLSRK